MARPESWLRATPAGLYCEPGDFFIDPVRPVPRAVVTHGHADHARPGHGRVLATAETLAMMRLRYGASAGTSLQAARYGERLSLGPVALMLAPAGHVLGSAQIVIEHAGARVIVSGDYKRSPDPTCAAFEPQRGDVFVTEATFGLPVFRHPPDRHEIAKLLQSVRRYPERCHLIGVYALGKCQRIIALLRAAGWDRPIYLHGALFGLTELYQNAGAAFGSLLPATGAAPAALRGQIVLAPPAALADRWTRRLPDPVIALASGWMQIKQRAKARGVELPLVISDHADWDALCDTIAEVDAGEIWVTHGREEALVHHAAMQGRTARALAIAGFGEEEE